jgi:hypothetical protein
MEYEKDITEESLPSASQLNAVDDNSAVPATDSPQPESVESLSLKELKDILGKDFKDKTTAIKSIKDTYSFVGMRKEDIAKEFDVSKNIGELASQIKSLKEDAFYKDRPDLAPHRALIKKLGDNPEEVINMPEFKSLYEPAKESFESRKLKTVLQSNPRIQSSQDNLSKARASTSIDERESLVAKAVLETLE